MFVEPDVAPCLPAPAERPTELRPPIHVLNVYHCYRNRKIKLAVYLTSALDWRIVLLGLQSGVGRRHPDFSTTRRGADLRCAELFYTLIGFDNRRWMVRNKHIRIAKPTLCLAIFMRSVRYRSRLDSG